MTGKATIPTRVTHRITQDEVLDILEETGPKKSLDEVCAELCGRRGGSLSQIPRDVVLAHLETLAKKPSLVDVSGEGSTRKWSIHFLK